MRESNAGSKGSTKNSEASTTLKMTLLEARVSTFTQETGNAKWQNLKDQFR